jgi:hypothetical protein
MAFKTAMLKHNTPRIVPRQRKLHTVMIKAVLVVVDIKSMLSLSWTVCCEENRARKNQAGIMKTIRLPETDLYVEIT